MTTQIKLILRALLPLLFIGANRMSQQNEPTYSPPPFRPGRCRNEG